jgi:hypothetical protein
MHLPVPGARGYDAPMRRLGCLIGCGMLAGVVLQGAPAAAAPRALLDAPRAEEVALAGGEVLVASTTRRGVARLTALPVGGGEAQSRLVARPPSGGDFNALIRLASSAELSALLVEFSGPEHEADWRVYAGPPAGPLAMVHRVRLRGPPRRLWMPVEVDVHGDRLLIQEIRLPIREGGHPRVASRVIVHAPGASPTLVSQGPYATPTVVAGDRIAYAAGTRRRPVIRIVDWRTGRLTDTIGIAGLSADSRSRHLDLTGDGRAVIELDGNLFTGAPGERARPLSGTDGAQQLTEPRIAGERVAAIADARVGSERPVVIEPDTGTRRAVGAPSTAMTALAADEATVAWLANGCVLGAGVTDVPPVEPVPPGPCPRAEVVLEDYDEKLRGRTLRVWVTCVAAPRPGCRGAVVLRFRGRTGRGRFRVPAGGRRLVKVRLTQRAAASVRRRLRSKGFAVLRMGARVTDGRVSREATTRWVAVDVRP